MYFSGLIAHLRQLLADEALDFVFQPIFDLRRPGLIGYEALMRGPEDSPLHTPEQLLRVARDAGLGLALERLAMRRTLDAFVAAELPGRMFINLSAAMLADTAPGAGLARLAESAGLPGGELVVECMDLRDEDAGLLATLLPALAAQGVGLAVDRLAEAGPAGSRRPDFVKLGPAHIRRLDCDGARQARVAAFLRQAATLGVAVIAEGVEDARELATLHALGCPFAQGYLLGRPAASPARLLSRGVASILSTSP